MHAFAALPDPAQLIELRTMRTALAELCLLAVAGGVVGAFVVLRRLAFFAHAVGTATFPGLVLAEAASFSPRVAGLAVALGYAGGVERAGRGGRDPGDAATGLMLVGALALGTFLASDVFESGAVVDRLLFGTVIGLDATDLVGSALAAVLAVTAAVLLGRAWVASAFDPEGAPSLGLPMSRVDGLLLALIAVAAVAALPAVGALLVTSVFVVPAAIARLFTASVRSLMLGSVAVALVQSCAGLYGSLWLDVPPGPAIAVLGAGAYGVCALARSLSPTAMAGSPA